MIKFRQGFGRLIRSKKDTGFIILFDRRVKNRSYGQKFLDSIPQGCPVSEINRKDILAKIDNNGALKI